ncbi:MAG: ANTAR domain-containing response regulator [Armatimonadota bacterium]
MRILLGGIDARDVEVYEALPPACTIFQAAVAAELVESVFACSPDVLIVSREMDGVWTALQQISLVLPAPVLVIARHTVDESSIPLASTDVFGYLVRPLNAATLQRMTLVAVGQFQRLLNARTEAAQLREAFASRKLIERAKGLIMQREQLSEAEAYSYLRNESRRQRVLIADIAKAILGEPEDETSVKKIRKPGGAIVDKTHSILAMTSHTRGHP